MQAKSLTMNRVNRISIIHLVVSLLVIFSSYLSLRHFFLANFPTSIFDGSFCDVSSFFNCDSSAFSFIAHIFGVPLGYFGIAIGTASFMGILFPSPEFERTNKFINFLNVLGILGLIVISLTVLHSICLLCVSFYIFAFINFFLYYRHGIDAGKGFFAQHLRPNFRILFGIGLLTLAGAVTMVLYHEAKIESQGGGVSNRIVQQYFNLPQVEPPSIVSPYYIHQSAENFADAPIRIIEYADFQCPDCLKLKNDLDDLKKEFGDKMNIVFQFFPLDAKCNDVVDKNPHPQACDLCYIAAHDPDKFKAIHDEIFANFNKTRNDGWVRDLAARYGVEAAFTDENTKRIVSDILNTGKEYEPTSDRFTYGIRSTPTMILNERLVIGTLPKVQLRAIFKAIIERELEGREGEKKQGPRFIEHWR